MSTFFKDLDEKSRHEMARAMNTNKEYERIMNDWRKPYERRQLKKAARALREASREPVKSQEAVVYVHNPEQGVALPPHPEDIFAVIRVKGKQTKVLLNDVIKVEKLPFEVGSQICIDEVLMVGSPDYTAIGRPTVEKARVYASIEEEAQCEKSIIFKLRRRKGYMRSRGHRQQIMVLRIDRIEHDLSEADFSLEAQKAQRMQLMKTPTSTYNICL